MPAEALIPFAALIHIIGAAIGAAFSTYAEVYYLKAVADDRIDHHERKYLRKIFRALHTGIIVTVTAGVALIVLEYLVSDATQAVLSGPFWALQTITLVIALLGWEISKRQASWWIASGAIVTGWWMILLTDLGVFNAFGYLELLFTYLLLTLIVAAILRYIRLWTWKPHPVRPNA